MKAELAGIERLEQSQKELETAESIQEQGLDGLREDLGRLKAVALKEVINGDQMTTAERVGWLYALKKHDTTQTTYTERAQAAASKLEELSELLGEPGVPFIFHKGVLRAYVFDRGYEVGVSAGSGLHLNDNGEEWWKADIEVEKPSAFTKDDSRKGSHVIATETRHLLKAITEKSIVNKVETDLMMGFPFSFVVGADNVVRMIERLAESVHKEQAQRIFAETKVAGVDLAQHSDNLANALETWRSEIAQNIGEHIVYCARSGADSDSLSEEISDSITSTHRTLGVDENIVKEAALAYNKESHKAVDEVIGKL